ncbi:MAG: RNA pseudouridine synthase [Puniceicoccales bacterium]|jgi:23S rRNA pseudouridine955/2504/2580 synthase|nr:RNA pseudouridine synthase [Puniceicoccales bacterium]
MVDGLLKILGKGVVVAGYDGNGLVALDKPCGILSHPNGNCGGARAVLSCRYDAVEQAYVLPCGRRIYLLNRLDSPVSGLILVSLGVEIADAVEVAFEEKKVNKEYVALTKGFPRHNCGIWRSKMEKKLPGKFIKVIPGAGVFAETKFECEGSFRVRGVTLSIVKLFPITGKTHQLRVHCAQNGLPIVGDETYGNPRFNAFLRKNFENYRLFLHSRRISLSYAIGRKFFDFDAVSTVDFMEIVKNFRCEKN